MESALAWIGQIAAWFGMWIPRWVVLNTTVAAVKFVKGNQIVVCGPGIHWYWPVTTELMLHPTARQSNNLKSQTITTRDNKTIVVGGLIVFEITDIEKVLAHTFEPDNTINDITLGSIHDVCCQLSWDELIEGQRDGSLDRKLKTEARRDLDRYGVKVIRMTLTDLAPCRVLKLMNTNSLD